MGPKSRDSRTTERTCTTIRSPWPLRATSTPRTARPASAPSAGRSHSGTGAACTCSVTRVPPFATASSRNREGRRPAAEPHGIQARDPRTAVPPAPPLTPAGEATVPGDRAGSTGTAASGEPAARPPLRRPRSRGVPVHPEQPLVVLQSFPQPRPTTNPYLVMLHHSLEDLGHVSVMTFSWRRALLARYDVFHVHWPEILVNGRSPLKKLVRQVLSVLLLLRLRLTRAPLVRTMHNLQLPQGITRRETALLRWAERGTALRIAINETTELVDSCPVATIVHGHCRDWYGAHPRAERVPGRLTFFGLVRRYKGVDQLVTAFEQTRGTPGLSL